MAQKYTGEALMNGRGSFFAIDLPGTGSTSGTVLYGVQNASLSASKDMATATAWELDGGKIHFSTGKNYEISIDGLYLKDSISGETYTKFSGDSHVEGGISPVQILEAFDNDYTSKLYWKVFEGYYITFTGVISAHDINMSEADPATFSLTILCNGSPTISAS